MGGLGHTLSLDSWRLVGGPFLQHTAFFFFSHLEYEGYLKADKSVENEIIGRSVVTYG